MRYPLVLSETATLDQIWAGRAIARFGDGELKLATGRSIKSQLYHPKLQEALRAVLQDPGGPCLVGIPNIASTPRTPKEPFWAPYRGAGYTRLYDHRATYASSFISRPDSAPWIDTPAYWNRIRHLWQDREVWVMGGSQKGWRLEELKGARQVRMLTAPRQQAWAVNRDLFQVLREADPEVLIFLSLGPTATVLAHQLAHEGRWALDLGHLPMFLRHKDDPTVDLKGDL